DVVGLSRCEATLQHRLGKHVVKLKAMLGPAMSERNCQIRVPVARAVRTKGHEHSLEESASLISTLEFLWNDVEAPELKAQALNEFGRAAPVAQNIEVLVENRLARPAGVPPLSISDEDPAPQIMRLARVDPILALVTVVAQRHQQERRREKRGA